MRGTNLIDRRILLSFLAVLPALQPRTAIAQQAKQDGSSAFSFAVYGDSRSMMYLPYKSAQREEAVELMVDMFDLVFLPGRTAIKVSADYPPDLYWKGQPPKEEYNYLLVDVQPGQKTKFTLNRFRPWSAEPFATVEVFT